MSNMTTFEDSVKERLKEIVTDLIPEDRWDNLVRATVQDFEKKDLPAMVKDALRERYKVAIVAELNKPEWQGSWDSVGVEASDKLKALLIEAAPLVLASMLGGAMQGVVDQMRYALQR